jgi:hypothetical protein
MKTHLTSLIIPFLFIYNFCAAQAQETRCVSVRGNEFIIPVNPHAADTCSITLLNKETLSKIEKLVCTDTSFKIISFTAVFQFDDIFPSHCKSEMLSPAARNFMDKLEPGKRMWFEQIDIKSPDGSITTIPGFCIRVK